MNIDIDARNTTLTAALENHVREKMRSLESRLDKNEKDEIYAHVVLEIDHKGVHRADAQVVGHRKLHEALHAVAETDNMYTSINQMTQNLARQWRDQKSARIAAKRTADTIRKPGAGVLA